MVSFTTSVSWPLAAVTSVFKFSQTCRNWATRSPLPTWPARKSMRPPRVSAAWEKPTGFMSEGGLWSAIWRVIWASLLGTVQHDRVAVGRVVVEQLGRYPGHLGRLDEPPSGIEPRHRLDRFLERSPRPGRDLPGALPREIGRGEPGADGVDGHARAGYLGGERPGEADERVLGRGVRGHVRSAVEPGERGDVD